MRLHVTKARPLQNGKVIPLGLCQQMRVRLCGRTVATEYESDFLTRYTNYNLEES